MRIVINNAQQIPSATRRIEMQAKADLMAGRRIELSLKEATRSTEQNARMWAMLAEIAAQVVWHGRKLTACEWKHVFSASLKRQDVVPGLDGGFVVLGTSTSKMTIREMGDLMELMSAFGAQQGVRFSAPEYA